MLRRVAIAVTFTLLMGLCGGLAWFNLARDRAMGDPGRASLPLQTISARPVVLAPWQPSITAIGTARAASGVELAVQIGGVVREIRFKANDAVDAEQPLVQLDDSVEKADLIDAQAVLKLNEAALDRTSNLRLRGFDTQAAYDQTVAAVATARSKLTRTQAIIALKSVKAPFAGMIGIPRINVGQYVQPGTVVATLQDLNHIKVDFTVPEQLADKVKPGSQVSFSASGSDLAATGTVTGIDPRIDPATRLVAMQADVTETQTGRIQPGQFLRVRIALPREPGVLAVPQTAITTSLYGDYVYIVEEDSARGERRLVARQSFVKVGRREGLDAEILSGIALGQTVVTSGQNKLQSGTPVRIDNVVDVARPAQGS